MQLDKGEGFRLLEAVNSGEVNIREKVVKDKDYLVRFFNADLAPPSPAIKVVLPFLVGERGTASRRETYALFLGR